MIALLRGLVLRRIARHRVRSLLAALAVALGVAAFLATHAVGRSIASASTAVVRRVAGGVALSVEGGDAALPAAIAIALREQASIDAAAPLVVGFARVPDARKGRVLLLGVDPIEEPKLERLGAGAMRDEELALSDPFAFVTGMGAVLTAPLATELDVAVGDSFSAQGAQGARSFRVLGIVGAEGMASAASGRVAITSVGGAQSLLGRGDVVNRIDLRPAEGVTIEQATADARRVLDQAGLRGAYVGPPRLADETAKDVLAILQVGLDIGALVSLFIGVFLIHHTLAVGVAERRREVGILRALGATRGQVAAVFCAEAILLGGVGSVVGVALAYALAASVLQGFAATLSTIYFGGGAPDVGIPLTEAVLGVVVGLLVSIVAAVVPAHRAAKEAPSDSIRRGPLERPMGALDRWVRGGIAAFGIGITLVLVLFPSVGQSGGWFVWGATLAPLAAFLALAPYILMVAARLLSPVLAAVGGIPGRLAADDLLRNPQRAALPAAALAVGLALVVETHGNAESLATETLEWMESDIAGDLFVSSGQRVMGMGGHTLLDAEVTPALREVPGVAHAVGLRIVTVPWEDTRLMFLALDIEPYRAMSKIAIEGRAAEEALARCAEGDACIISNNLAQLQDVDVGDSLRFEGVRGPFDLEIVGRFRDYSWPRGTLLLDRSVVRIHLNDDRVDQFSLKLKPGADEDAVARAIDAEIGEGRELVLTSGAELREGARELLQEIFALSYAQVAVALAVAFLGVLNALWIAVVLRRRELGLLRSVGATTGQLVTSVVLQGAALGVVGGILGVIGGAGIQWLALNRLMPAETGWTYPMRFPYAEAAFVVLLGTITSAVASALPARRAAKTPIRDAIAYE